jgi:disulfide bond formation protein DsbB
VDAPGVDSRRRLEYRATMPSPVTPSTSRLPADARHRPALAAALAVLAIGGAALAGAWGFQLIGGLPPCHLCLLQRIPYYLGLPVAAAVALGAWRGVPPAWLRLGLALVALAMLTTAGIAAYHAGVEWGWWAGPADCSGEAIKPLGSVDDLLAQMNTVQVVRCDVPALVVLGLSLAGWNVLLSLGLAAVALRGAFARG